MASIRCWAVRNVVDLYVDERLTNSKRAAVGSHLRGCDACREEAQALSGVRSRLASARALRVPAGLADSILKKLGEAEVPAPSLRPSPAQAAALAALALILLAQRGPGAPSQGAEANAPRLEAR